MGTVTPKIVWIFLDICRFTTSLFFSFFLAPEWRGYWHVFSGRQLRPRLYLWFGQIHMHSCWCVGKSNFPTLISIRSCSSRFPTSLERWQLCKWPAMSSLHSSNLRTANDELRKSPQITHRKPMMWYSRGDWELKTQNGRCIYETFLGSPDHRLLFIHVCVPRVVQKSASTNLSRGLDVIKPASRKTMAVTQRISKYVTSRSTPKMRINVPCTQTYRWKEKLAVLMLPGC